MKKVYLTLFILPLMISVARAELVLDPEADPRLRDEDISATMVDVEVSITSEGFYRYEYTVIAPVENKGHIRSFRIDLSCEEEPDRAGLPEQPESARFIGNSSADGKHAPVVISVGEGGKGLFSVSRSNQIGWGIHLSADQTVSGLILTSTSPPVNRRYKLVPFMDTSGWDYGAFEEDDPEVPWIDDFTVRGMIEGPGCSADEPPPEEESRFPGTSHGFGPERINQLLTYSEPLRDQFHVPEGTETLTMTIHYHEQIDPDTFRVQPAWARRLFNVEPGTSETVELPLRHHRNRFQLEVHPVKSDLPRHEDPYHHSFKDKDVFDIRVEGARTPPGQERNQGQGR